MNLNERFSTISAVIFHAVLEKYSLLGEEWVCQELEIPLQPKANGRISEVKR